MASNVNWQALVEIITIIVSGAALLISYLSLRRSSKNQQKLIEIENEREKDRKKAQLKPELVKEYQDKLCIENISDNKAINVEIFINGRPITEHPDIKPGQELITVLGAKSSCYYLMAAAKHKNSWNVRITWTNDSGEEDDYETIIQY